MGCEVVKLFPGGIFGPDFVKAIRGPQPWTSIMPTGGVSPTKESIEKWFNAGVSCVGMGSKLIKKEQDGTYNFETITATVKNVLQLIENIKEA